MKTSSLKSLFLTLFCAMCLVPCAFTQNWDRYRGPESSGVFDGASLPATWDGATGENIEWTTPVPGIGLSSPVIWENKLFITTAVGESDIEGLKPGIYGDIAPVEDSSQHEWIVYCIDTESGKILWEKVAHKGIPGQKRHPMSSHASASMAVNGEYALAFFGSEGLFCYDFEGNLIWEKNFGILKSVYYFAPAAEFEWASSPIIHENYVIVQVDVMDQSFVAAFDIHSGEEIWRTNRDELPTWCTPNIYFNDGKARVVLNGFKRRAAYDFETGEEIWWMTGGGDIPIPTPLVSDDMLYFNSSHGWMRPIFAIKKNARGDISLGKDEEKNEFVVWSKKMEGAYMASMLIYDGLLYVGKWNGSFACFDAQTGELFYKETLVRGKSFTGSPVAADGKIYFTSDEGIVYVMQAGKEFNKIAELPLGSTCMVTPAIKKGQIFFRTVDGIMAVGQ